MENVFKGVIVKRNITDISFMILNMKRASASISELDKRVSFPVYQEPANRDIMGMLGGKKDDMLIFDRCGLLVYHFKMPYSHLRKPYVWNALTEVYNNKVSKCQRYCPTTTTASTTQSTTTMPMTSQEFSANYGSESATSQPRPETTTTSSPVTTGENFNRNNTSQRFNNKITKKETP